MSVATVSRALNGHPEVSDTTRRLVQETAERLGYRPSHSARSLVRGRSDTVGLLWDTGYEATGRHHPFLQALLVGVKRALSSAGRHVLLLNVEAQDADERVYVDAARQHQLDGVVLFGVDDTHPAVRRLVHSGLPCVAIDLPIAGPRAAYVTSDNRDGAAAAVRHLHALGHRRVAAITGPLDLLPAVDRLAGFDDAARGLGLAVPAEYVENGDFFLDSGYAAGLRLSALSAPPTAVFVAGDEMAIGAMHAFMDQGMDVPRDIAVVGFDDIEAASLVRPALTTVAQDPVGLGRSAVEALLALMNATEPVPPVTIATRLVVRGSCGGGPAAVT